MFLKLPKPHSIEASSHDRINMTQFWLEHDQKFLRQTFLINVNMLDENDEYDKNFILFF